MGFFRFQSVCFGTNSSESVEKRELAGYVISRSLPSGYKVVRFPPPNYKWVIIPITIDLVLQSDLFKHHFRVTKSPKRGHLTTSNGSLWRSWDISPKNHNEMGFIGTNLANNKGHHPVAVVDLMRTGSNGQSRTRSFPVKFTFPDRKRCYTRKVGPTCFVTALMTAKVKLVIWQPKLKWNKVPGIVSASSLF